MEGKKQSEFIVALNNIRSLYNVGSIFRSADAFGVKKIICGGYTGAPPSREITKTALGAEEWIPFERAYHLPTRLKELRQEGFSLVGLENNREAVLPISSYVFSFPLVLVIGNEVKGITPAVGKILDAMVSIPMQGKKESLNVAVAFGIAAYYIAGRLT